VNFHTGVPVRSPIERGNPEGMTMSKSLLESPSTVARLAGDVTAATAARVSRDLNRHRTELLYLLATLGFAALAATLGFVLLTS
jgi:hypothetical protein